MLVKKIIIGVISSILCISIIVPVHAESEQQNWLSDLMAESNEIATILDEFGISTTDLLEITAMPKKDSSFYGVNKRTNDLDPDLEVAVKMINEVNTTPFRPSDYGLDVSHEIKSPQPRAPYDVNPPLTTQEQEQRIDYLTNIIETEYYQERYQDKLGKYYLYLYTSHWTENSNFERDGDNYFDKIYANIICQNDIDAFESFYSKVQGGAVSDVFVGLGNTVSTVKSFAQGDLSKVEKIIESLKVAKASIGSYADDFTKSLSDQGIDTTTIHDIASDMTTIYKSNYNDVQSAEEMINLIHGQMNQYGVNGYATKVYVDLMSSIITDAVFTGFAVPFIGCGVYYFKVLADIYPMVTLASLYYSYSIRRADRMSIYYGLFDRP